MIYVQAIMLCLALYFTTTMLHNWVLIHSSLELQLGDKTVYRNITGRLAALFWALFFLFYQLGL